MEKVNLLVNEIVKSIESDHYSYLILATKNAFTSRLYTIDGDEATYDTDSIRLFEMYSDRIQRDLFGIGILLIHKEPGKSHAYRIIPHYNCELHDTDLFELIIFQDLGVQPVSEERKAVLKNSIKAEKIKKSLVYSCYVNDADKILMHTKKASKTQLDRRMKYTGTPLAIAFEHSPRHC